MIKNIYIRNIATFGDTVVSMQNLKKINFIYGSNGSGKTTISNFIKEPENPDYGDCILEWKYDIQINTLVYNKKFREENFGRGLIPGIFTLGSDSVDEMNLLNDKTEKLSEIHQEGIREKRILEKQKNKKEETEERFKENFWQAVYKKYEHQFYDVFKGCRQKKSLKDKILREFETNSSKLLSYEAILEKYNNIFGQRPEWLDKLKIPDFSDIGDIEKHDIWNKKIIGKEDIDIAELIKNLGINDWVFEGRNYIQEDSKKCPFCQQETISPDFRNQLEEYFDDSFRNDISNLKQYSDRYESAYSRIISNLKLIETREKDNNKTRLNIEKFSGLLYNLEKTISANLILINSKLKEPSRAFEIISSERILEGILDTIEDANNEIIRYNKIVDNYLNEKVELISLVWKYLSNENESLINEYFEQINGLQTGINNLIRKIEEKRVEYRNLEQDIRDITADITSVKPTIDRINSILLSFGFDNFQIEPSLENKHYYKIRRNNGEPAEDTLSEGEITLITFLYFIQLAEGSLDKDNITTDRIIVLDDPVSSLDSNVLFLVSSLLKKIIDDVKRGDNHIKQFLLFTHNVYFHKEVTYINGRSVENRDTNFWILRRTNSFTSIKNYYMSNPICNSYELLWKELFTQENTSGIYIQNIMRRIIENYFKILGRIDYEDIINKFDEPGNKEICRSLIGWINEGSHTIPDDIFVDVQEDTIGKYFNVFKLIFEKNGQIEHYNMMKQGVLSTGTDDYLVN